MAVDSASSVAMTPCPHCMVARPDHEPLRCTKRKLEPNMKRLVIRFMTVDAVPAGGGFASVASFLLDSERVKASARRAFQDAVTAVVAVRAAPDFADLKLPDDSEETIADMLVRKIEEANEQVAKRHRLDLLGVPR